MYSSYLIQIEHWNPNYTHNFNLIEATTDIDSETYINKTAVDQLKAKALKQNSNAIEMSKAKCEAGETLPTWARSQVKWGSA